MTVAVLSENLTTPSGLNKDGITSVATAAWTVTAGSVLLCFVTNDDDGTTITVSDTLNGSYGASVQSVTATGVRKHVLFAKTNSLGGSNTVTATFSGNTNGAGLWVIEVGGAATSGAVDTHNARDQVSPGTGTDAITTNSATNSAQPALVIAVSLPINGSGGTSPLTGTGFTAGIDGYGETSGTAGHSENKRVTSTGSQTATFTARSGTDLFEFLSIMVNVLEASGGHPANTAAVFNVMA